LLTPREAFLHSSVSVTPLRKPSNKLATWLDESYYNNNNQSPRYQNLLKNLSQMAIQNRFSHNVLVRGRVCHLTPDIAIGETKLMANRRDASESMTKEEGFKLKSLYSAIKQEKRAEGMIKQLILSKVLRPSVISSKIGEELNASDLKVQT
jgi:hypothetical protein